MDALLRINRHFGITVICNLHSLDLARSYCDRLIGMAAGRVVFDGDAGEAHRTYARELYDLEADEVMGSASAKPDAVRSTNSGSGLPRYRVAVDHRDHRSAVASTRKLPQPPTGEDIMINRRHFVSAGAIALAFTAAPPHADDWKAKYPELTFAVVPAENASGVTDRYTPFVDYLSKELGIKVNLRIANDYAAVIEGQRAGNIQIAYYGPASFSRGLLTGVKTDAFVIDVNNDGTERLLFGDLCEGQQPLQEDRGSEGQEPRPGRSQLDLRQQRAALHDEPDRHRSRRLFLQVVFTGSHENARDGAGARARSTVAANWWNSDDST